MFLPCSFDNFVLLLLLLYHKWSFYQIVPIYQNILVRIARSILIAFYNFHRHFIKVWRHQANFLFVSEEMLFRGILCTWGRKLRTLLRWLHEQSVKPPVKLINTFGWTIRWVAILMRKTKSKSVYKQNKIRNWYILR